MEMDSREKKEIKAGVITFHRALNYGALLQAFALKETLCSLGVDTEVVDYRNDFMEKMYQYDSFFSQAGIKNKIRYLLYSKNEKRKRKKFDSFRNERLGLSKTIYRSGNISTANLYYDLFLTGSDQVWSPDAHELDDTFFLGFVDLPNKKYSYAASFGVDVIKPQFIDFYKTQLSNFKECSVREIQGKQIIDSLFTNKKVRIDVDPVLLLSKEEWVEKFSLQLSTDSYAFIYSFNLSNTQIRMAEACYYAGMKIYIVGTSIRNPLNVPCKYLGDLGPIEFLQVLYGASLVITNSFHGIALSIVCNVDFAMEYLQGSSCKTNSRLESIIKICNLQKRVISANTDVQDLLKEPVDWHNVNTCILEKRRDSINYLRTIIDAE